MMIMVERGMQQKSEEKYRRGFLKGTFVIASSGRQWKTLVSLEVEQAGFNESDYLLL